jgi:hypothetical protein
VIAVAILHPQHEDRNQKIIYDRRSRHFYREMERKKALQYRIPIRDLLDERTRDELVRLGRDAF